MLQITNHPTPAVRIQKARTALLLDHPFFGSLLFRLGGRASSEIQTMATDGASLFYSPEFVEKLNSAELAGVLAHEVMHPALQHHTRRGDRNRKRWNVALRSLGKAHAISERIGSSFPYLKTLVRAALLH